VSSSKNLLQPGVADQLGKGVEHPKTEESVVKQPNEVQGNAGHQDTTTEKALVQESADLHVEDKRKVSNPDAKKKLQNKRKSFDTSRRPDSIYKKYQKLLKKRHFPCPNCGHAADGSHQCVVCFAHVHVICGTLVEDSCEGYGQLVYCEKCETGGPNTTKPLHDTSEESSLAQLTPPRPSTEPDLTIPPAGFYGEQDTVWRERKFPCPGCGDPANGTHQCVGCFVHVHENCGIICVGSSQCVDKQLYCGVCSYTNDCTSQTQVWKEENEEREMAHADKDEVHVSNQEQEEKTRLQFAEFFTSLDNERKEETKKTHVLPAKKRRRAKKKGKIVQPQPPFKTIEVIPKEDVGLTYDPRSVATKRNNHETLYKSVACEIAKELFVNDRVKKKKKAHVKGANLNESNAAENATLYEDEIKEDTEYEGKKWRWSDTFGDWVHWSVTSKTWVYGGAKRVKTNPTPPSGPPPNNGLVLDENSDCEDDAGKQMQWSEKYGACVLAGANRVRKKDLTNNMATVETHPCPCNTHLNVSWGAPVNSFFYIRCTVICTKTAFALLKTSSMTYQQTTAMTLRTQSLCSHVQKRSKSSLLKEELAVIQFSMG
jgi:hypothetical protein